MRELVVSTQTTPVELADFFNGLPPDGEVGGRPGAGGSVILHIYGGGRRPRHPASVRGVIAARVAIDVVLQQVDGMPGAQPLVDSIREQLAGDAGATAGWLAPPLALLARLYAKTTSPMPGGRYRIWVRPDAGCDEFDTDLDEEATLTP